MIGARPRAPRTRAMREPASAVDERRTLFYRPDMRVLFIGGTGIISSACSELAVERGIELYLLCRGRSPRPIPKGVKVLSGDIRDAQSARAALGSLEFDAVADFISFVPEH